MKDTLVTLHKEFEKKLTNVSERLHLEELEQEYFGRKSGKFTLLAKEMKDVSKDIKKEIGQLMNDVRTHIVQAIEARREELGREEMSKIAETERIDVTQPQLPKKERGHIHPISQGLKDMTDVALSMGFLVEDGPELESQRYVFDALNFPPDHPAREGMDTFYIKEYPDLCMRAHVSNMQVRLMKKYNEGGTKAVRAAYPGRVFRNEDLDATHEHTFYQFE
ncbi:MAG: phenylalanine--tRNA ligase subunit alpha, partial [Candidatus Magasanikbacteria bacterium CG11_big_fil_rev_8_21_14_0_20_43_7]